MSTRTLHVGALPFPSSQGTQAALLAIVRALADDARSRDERLALLTYEAGDGRALLPPNVDHLRTRALLSNGSLRSGPSVAKILEDLSLVEQLRRSAASEIVAHHVEAALACWLAGRRFTWVAHTALGPELPLYLPPSARGLVAQAALQRAGRSLDGFLARRAARVFAVSPLLAQSIEEAFGVEARVLPIPWPSAPAVSAGEREEARDALGLGRDDEVVLYAGNLDRYQGLDTAIAAIAIARARRARLAWLVATESDAAELRASAARMGLAGALVVTRLEHDLARRHAHAAADVAIVPRRLAAGLSVKILEALSHGVPTIAVQAALGGFDFEDALVVVPDDAAALGAAIDQLLADDARRHTLSARGHAHLERAHGAEALVRALRA